MSSKEKKLAAAAEQAKKNRKFYTACIIFVVCLAIVVVAAALINSDIKETKTTAITIGETEYSPADFSYFYRSAVSTTYASLTETYGDMAAYLLDNQAPLSEQVYMFGDGTQTWAEYLIDYATNSAKATYAMVDAAATAGYTLPETYVAAVDNEMTNLTLTAVTNGFPDVKTYLTSIYGNGASAAAEKTIGKA